MSNGQTVKLKSPPLFQSSEVFPRPTAASPRRPGLPAVRAEDQEAGAAVAAAGGRSGRPAEAALGQHRRPQRPLEVSSNTTV